jgi:hypothetical protein
MVASRPGAASADQAPHSAAAARGAAPATLQDDADCGVFRPPADAHDVKPDDEGGDGHSKSDEGAASSAQPGPLHGEASVEVVGTVAADPPGDVTHLVLRPAVLADGDGRRRDISAHAGPMPGAARRADCYPGSPTATQSAHCSGRRSASHSVSSRYPRYPVNTMNSFFRRSFHPVRL